MMTPEQREHALDHMQQASHQFYKTAKSIGSDPFIEFAGLMNEYIDACKGAHAQGIDFTECNQHSGLALPLHPVMSDRINEKLARIFSGSKILDAASVPPGNDDGFAIPPFGRPA